MVSLGYNRSLIYERIWNLSRNYGGSSKTCGFTTGFEISGKFDFEFLFTYTQHTNKLAFISEMEILKGPSKHAVLQQDLKFRENLILRSKCERFMIVHKHWELAAQLGKNVQFEKILIFLDTHQAHFEILDFSNFFSQKSQLKSQKITFFAQICVPHVRKSKFLFETTFSYI